MAITILNSTHSFVRFGEAEQVPHCIWGSIDYCLPVYASTDVAFQFVIAGTEAEIDTLCTLDGSGTEVAIIEDCGEAPLLTFTEKPQRFRLSLTQVLFNWEYGVPGFTSVVALNECFRIQVTVGGVEFCSNCFEKIPEDCFTSVIEYGQEDDAFGFKYCYAGGIDEDTAVSCEPTIVQFINVPTLAIPYTASLQDSYGVMPTVQTWIYDGMGQLVNMGITEAFDTFPPTVINLDFGGPATGIVVIR